MPLDSLTARLQEAGSALPLPRLPRIGGGARRLSAPGPSRRMAWTVALAALGLVAAIYLLLRLTGLSAVQNVTVVGVQGPNAPELRRAIERAASGQSTLGFDEASVRRAVAGDASITGVEVETRFPHGVQVQVHQRLAVGAIAQGSGRVAVSADGRLLPDWPAGQLPVIQGGRANGERLLSSQREAVAILGVAPAPILARVARVEHLTTVRLVDGPALLFRDDHRLRAKWAAAAAVLADPSSAGATWIDLRVPEQPVAGRGPVPTLPKANTKAPDLRQGAGDDALRELEQPAAGGVVASRGAADQTASGAGTGAGTTAGGGAASGATGATGTGTAETPTSGGATAATGPDATATGGGATARGTTSTSTGATGTGTGGAVGGGATPGTTTPQGTQAQP
ncbi:cell division protein FtsQ/DivIB [Patulibacter defluvii]|uniref:cell division protein FtsQ/DivIB n=1 Tax=Patulibacter defluvii TaxID=3095358 RepID=UPI002A74B6EE|nr:hypothetical protein [Patulibacter sp. DM4]